MGSGTIGRDHLYTDRTVDVNPDDKPVETLVGDSRRY